MLPIKKLLKPTSLTVADLSLGGGWATRTIYANFAALGGVRVGRSIRFPIATLRERLGDAVVDEILVALQQAAAENGGAS